MLSADRTFGDTQEAFGSTHERHADPLLHDPSSLRWRRAGGGAGGAAQQGYDDQVGHAIKLRHGGPDGGGHVLLLVSLRPDAAQTLVRSHFGK